MTAPTSDLRSLLVDTLAPFTWLRLVVLFGSSARGQQRDDSDIDVAVLADRPLSAERRLELMDALALAFGRPVDLVDLCSVGEPLLSRIVAGGQVMRGSTSDWAKIMFRNAVENADFVPLQDRLLRERREAWIKQ